MNKQNWIIFALALALIGFTGVGMHRLKTHQTLGLPGIKTAAIAGSPRLDVYLPEKVLDYSSEIIPTDAGVLNGLPQDTSFMTRRYFPPSRRRPLLFNVVLMGTDRTSIHKPQFCLTGQGWNIDGGESTTNTIRVESPHPYDLPVMKLVSTREVKVNGQTGKRPRHLCLLVRGGPRSHGGPRHAHVEEAPLTFWAPGNSNAGLMSVASRSASRAKRTPLTTA